MDDLISRQFAIDAIDHIFPVDTEYDCTLLDRVDVRRVLSDLPSAQPERIRGRWNRISPARIYECSVCGQNVMTNDIAAYKYCHGCGAEMEQADE